MNQTPSDALAVVLERDMPHPVEKVWQALTQAPLIEKWLMKNDFEPVVGREFELRGEWGGVACKVLTLEPNQKLSYTWSAFGLESVVTFTLTSTGSGTRLHLEQSGFTPQQTQFYEGAKGGWQGFLPALEQVVAQLS